MSGEHRAGEQPAQSSSSRYPGRGPAVLVEGRAVGARPAPARRLGTCLGAVGPPNGRSASGRGASPDGRTGDNRSARASQPADPDQASYQQRQEGRTMTAAQPGSLDRQGVRSLEVRWIFPGPLPGAVAGWFGRFPAETRVLEDVYLLDPYLPGLSVKVREARALEVKMYHGSPGFLGVAGRARGRLESWQKWSFPHGPPAPKSADLAGWRPVSKRRRISRFPQTSGARVPETDGEPGCAV